MTKLTPIAWNILDSFPENTLQRVKNRRAYKQYLGGIVFQLLAILDIAWTQLPTALEVTLA
jgi:hypothetical protein